MASRARDYEGRQRLGPLRPVGEYPAKPRKLARENSPAAYACALHRAERLGASHQVSLWTRIRRLSRQLEAEQSDQRARLRIRTGRNLPGYAATRHHLATDSRILLSRLWNPTRSRSGSSRYTA